MTFEEVKAIRDNPTLADADNAELSKLIDEAFEKQIAKKPTFDGDGYAPDGTFVWDEWLCPCCGNRYEVDFDDYAFCPNCGQKIDWRESE